MAERCGQTMVGSGTDTYDPICDLLPKHKGACMSSAAIDQHRLWTLPDVAKLLGMEYRTLHAWAQRGLLSARLGLGKGTGRTALLDRDDIRRARVLENLRRAGMGMKVLDLAAKRDLPNGTGTLRLELPANVEVSVWVP